MGLLKLHDEKGSPVYVNSDYVTSISKSPTSRGTVVGLVGDDLGCDVAETADQIAGMMDPEIKADQDKEPVKQQRQRKKFPLFERKVLNGKEEKVEQADRNQDGHD